VAAEGASSARPAHRDNSAPSFGGHSMIAPLRRVAVKRPQEAFGDPATIGAQWEALNYSAPPDLERAAKEHERLVAILQRACAEMLYLPEDPRTGLDSIYAHDPCLITDAGAVIFQTGKAARRGEGPACADAFRAWGIPIHGTVDGAAFAEGGDLIWLDSKTLLAGRGFRTNAAGIEKLRALLAPLGAEVIEVPLPYGSGPADVLHLMSFISLLDRELAVVHRPLLPVPLFELLTERGVELVDIPGKEYASQGCNVLALAPREALMLAGNPQTRARLERAGCRVQEYEGAEISLKGSGGPTCLTRPLLRR